MKMILLGVIVPEQTPWTLIMIVAGAICIFCTLVLARKKTSVDVSGTIVSCMEYMEATPALKLKKRCLVSVNTDTGKKVSIFVKEELYEPIEKRFKEAKTAVERKVNIHCLKAFFAEDMEGLSINS